MEVHIIEHQATENMLGIQSSRVLKKQRQDCQFVWDFPPPPMVGQVKKIGNFIC